MSSSSRTEETGEGQASRGGPFLKGLAGFLLFPTLALGLILGGVSLGIILFEASHQGRIYPGVTAWNADLSGMTLEEARSALLANFTYPDQLVFTFRDPGTGQTWVATPTQLGLRFDVDATVAAAYQIGRGDTLWRDLTVQADVYRAGRHLSPVFVFDSDAAISFLEALALEIYEPVVNAGLIFAEDRLVATPSQVGRQMNLAHAYDQLAAPFGALSGADIEMLIDETQPEITDEAVVEVLVEAKRITGRPITVFLDNRSSEDDPEPRDLTRDELTNMLVLELDQSVSPPRYSVRLDENDLAVWLEELATQLETEPVSARFVFNDETRELEVIQNSAPGRRLDTPATVQQIQAQAATDTREVPLVIEWVQPPVNDEATAEELGITELIAQGRTFFAGSSDVRVHNVAIAASRFHGVVVPPGETFSFNEFLGDVSEETGFEQGLIIFGGRTIEGVGGGVCQVSTTAFQAAFYAGFPILQRYPHGYRVGYYEKGEGPGMDATVYYPEVDFQFENDTPHHVLIETYTNERAQRLTFRFYSTSDGRTVEKVSTEITDVVPHPPDLYEEDPELETGEIEKVDWAADGANVVVKRVVKAADGSVTREDTFFSHYLPWQAVYHYGPGTEGMPPPEPSPESTPTPGPSATQTP